MNKAALGVLAIAGSLFVHSCNCERGGRSSQAKDPNNGERNMEVFQPQVSFGLQLRLDVKRGPTLPPTPHGAKSVVRNVSGGTSYTARAELLSILESTPQRFRAPLPDNHSGYVDSDIVIYRGKPETSNIVLLLPRATAHDEGTFDFSVDSGGIAHLAVVQVSHHKPGMQLSYLRGDPQSGTWIEKRVLMRLDERPIYTKAHIALLKSEVVILIVAERSQMLGLEGLYVVSIPRETSPAVNPKVWKVDSGVTAARVAVLESQGVLVLWNPYRDPFSGLRPEVKAVYYRGGRFSQCERLQHQLDLSSSTVTHIQSEVLELVAAESGGSTVMEIIVEIKAQE